MAQLTDAQLLLLFGQYLPDNEDQLIDPIDLRYVLAQLVAAKVSLDVLVQFAQLASPRFTGTPQVPTAPAGTDSNQVASTAFVQAALSVIASGKSLSELVLPQNVQVGILYLTGNGIWEARRTFSATADPVNGPNWRLIAGFAGQLNTINAANISDATDAGRAMLLAPSMSAQRALVNNPQIPAGSYGNHPSFNTEDGPAGTWAWVFRAIIALQNAPTVTIQWPNAPTSGQVDDQGDTFSFQPTVANPSFAQYMVAGLPQTTGAEWLNSANCYVQRGRIYVRVVGAVPVGGLAVYVGASGSVPAGQVLTNDTAFTANNVVPTLPGALVVDFTVNSATLSPGETLTFSARATGGTAPYQHSVQALNPDTGTVTNLGTASTPNFLGTWPKVPAGVYLVTDAVTDAAGASLVSATRRVVVAVPGNGGGDVNLLDTNNTWNGTNYFDKGVQFKNATGFDEYGQLFIYTASFGNKHAWRDNVYSLASDSLIGWRNADYTTSGENDVGLGRQGPGVLEVNAGTKGSLATLSVLDVQVSSVQNVALNTFGKLAAFAQGLVARLASKADLDDTTKQLKASQLPTASTTTLGAVRLSMAGGIRQSGVNQSLRNEAVYYTTEIEYTYNSNEIPSATFGLSYALTDFPAINLYPPTDTTRVGFVSAIRNRSASQATIITAYQATIDGQGSFTLAPGEQVWIKYVADGSYQVVLYCRASSQSGGGVTAAQLEAVRSTVRQSAPIAADYTLALADAGNLIQVAGAYVVTVPTNAAVAFAKGTIIELVPMSAGMPSIAAANGVSVLAATGNNGAGQGIPLRLAQLDINSWLLTGGS